jgi:hypothetical protein
MAIPDRPLNFRGGDLTLDELDDLLALMDANGKVTREGLESFRQVLAVASDWTYDELGLVKMSELAQVFSMIDREEQDAAVNPPSAAV